MSVETPHVENVGLKTEFGKLRWKNFSRDMCLVLRSLVSRLVPSFIGWKQVVGGYSNWHQTRTAYEGGKREGQGLVWERGYLTIVKTSDEHRIRWVLIFNVWL